MIKRKISKKDKKKSFQQSDEVTTELVPLEEVVQGELDSDKLPHLSRRQRQFVFEYMTQLGKTQKDFAEELGVHVQTVVNWLQMKEVQTYIKAIQSRMNYYLEESLKLIAYETMDQWRKLISQKITEENLDIMRKIIFEGIELLRGHMPTIGADSAEKEEAPLSTAQLRKRVEEMEAIDEIIDQDEEVQRQGKRRVLKAVSDL